jgi:hypothetical protein
MSSPEFDEEMLKAHDTAPTQDAIAVDREMAAALLFIIPRMCQIPGPLLEQLVENFSHPCCLKKVNTEVIRVAARRFNTEADIREDAQRRVSGR